MKKHYFALIGEPCYRYSRKVKELFFKDVYCRFLFMAAFDLLENQLHKHEAILGKILKELRDLAIEFEEAN
jgi:hypothetical protein